MKPLGTGLGTVVVLLLVSSPRSIQAQTTAAATEASTPLSYNVTQEVTLTGTVSSVIMKAAPGMIVGSHLLRFSCVVLGARHYPVTTVPSARRATSFPPLSNT